MADTKISALTEKTTIAASDMYPIAESGSTNKKVLGSTLRAQLSDWDAIIIKSADESVTSSTALQNDNELLFSVVAGGAYFFELAFAYDGPSAGDMKHDFALSAGSVTRGFRQHIGWGPTTVTLQAGQVGDMSTVIQCAANAGEKLLQVVRGYIQPSADATFNWRWAQNVSDGTSLTVKAGSKLAYRRIA